LLLSLHVDDIFYVSTNASLTKEFLRKVEDRFGKVKHKSGDVIPFLGMRIVKDASGSILVDQPQYIDELVAGGNHTLFSIPQRHSLDNLYRSRAL
jgi:hypothetical protein